MDKTSYCIACAGGSVWLGAVQDPSGMYLCDVEAAPQRGTMQFWSVVSLPGTDSYYLLNETAELFACFEADGKPITLRPLDVLDARFIVKFDNVGDGFVAINNSAKDRVFSAGGSPVNPGSPVFPAPWASGPDQRWKLVDADIALKLQAAPAIKSRAGIATRPLIRPTPRS